MFDDLTAFDAVLVTDGIGDAAAQKLEQAGVRLQHRKDGSHDASGGNSIDDSASRRDVLAEGDVDVVILGAGINGAGLFRDLCAQGVNCLIVDKADFGSGTSAAPSRLIHGGLKYLETGEFGLVAQSTLERNLLLQERAALRHAAADDHPDLLLDQGHLGGAAHPVRLDQRAAQPWRDPHQDRPGDLRFLRLARPGHAAPPLVGRKQALRDMPALTKSIVATGTYYDAKISHPERLVLELVDRWAGGQPALRRGQLHHADLRLGRCR